MTNKIAGITYLPDRLMALVFVLINIIISFILIICPLSEKWHIYYLYMAEKKIPWHT